MLGLFELRFSTLNSIVDAYQRENHPQMTIYRNPAQSMQRRRVPGMAAKIDARCNLGRSPVHEAARGGNVEMLESRARGRGRQEASFLASVTVLMRHF